MKYVAKLTRIKLISEEESKFSSDLGKILNYFKELQEVDTKNIKPLTGGSDLKNKFREDKGHPKANIVRFIKAFPDIENGFLKVPPVFE